MSLEELEKFIANGGEQKETKEEPIEIEIQEKEEEPDETVEEEPEEPAEEEPDESEKDFYKGKSKEDLVKMIENGELKKVNLQKSRAELIQEIENNTRIISQTNNEVFNLKQQINDLVNAKTQTERDSIEDDLLMQYDADQIKAIEKIVEKRLQEEKKLELEKSSAIIKANEAENETFWSNFKDINPDLAAQIEPKLMQEMQRLGRPASLSKAGFVKEFCKAEMAQNESKSKNNDTIIKKKKQALTATSSVSVPVSHKSEEEMTAEEYLEYAKKQGVTILR